MTSAIWLVNTWTLFFVESSRVRTCLWQFDAGARVLVVFCFFLFPCLLIQEKKVIFKVHMFKLIAN